MGLFTKDKKLEFKLIPSTPEQTSARSYLNDLEQNQIQYPTEQVADLGSNEQAIQKNLGSYLESSPGNYASAEKYYLDTLNGNYDPNTSQYYSGIRGQLDTQKTQALSAVNRQGQKSGMSKSTPMAAMAEQTGRNYDNQANTILGQLYDAERNRMAGAASGIQSLEANKVATLGNAQQIAQVERQVQQAKMTAVYNAAVQTMLAPYQYNAQIASTLLNEQRYIGVQTGGQMQDWAEWASLIGGVASGAMKGGSVGGIFGAIGGGIAGAGDAANKNSSGNTSGSDIFGGSN